ncbi:probable LRR receptor-like serine/threonine-protein kinase At1g05700 [Salvia miltiorrhiza]|uniref:probable LRR receptor-like serine/threonine-protein kinase At1g05700 n=1 Tax=Salvia miltiorrhiza TaxID=226208 RepID=UPI0025AC253F|nr:probable LRR receptor-like serine/threonine-protein kinase At1g05700 [Salvia miltiorrhiza]
MHKSVILFVVATLLFNLTLSAQGQPDSWIGIDCGSNKSTATFGLIWDTDEAFIKSGTNHLVPDNTLIDLVTFQTLRAFTDQNKNCYTLPRSSDNGYFIRAAFLYANYDGQSRPPTFDLEIDGNKWTTVVTTPTDYAFYEILYWTHKPNISVCLATTHKDEFPFISTLEAWPISYDMYTGLSRDLGWLTTYRYAYGSNTEVFGYIGGDDYNRIWEATSVANAVNTSGGSVSYCDENVPSSAIEDAVESPDNATSLWLNFGAVKSATPIFIEAYFTVTAAGYSDIRSFEMYEAGSYAATITPSDYSCTTQSNFVQISSGTNLSIELRPTAQSTLPPIISAIEIYTATDPLIKTGTNQTDLNGLMSFTNTYDPLKGWSGEPCLPADTVWQWLGCSATTPPRVTSLYLSGYQLNGSLTNFSQMQALVNIDLSNNDLSGEIPDFLGQLPNLRTLNLAYNDFSGDVPTTILNNRKLAYNVTGNPKLNVERKDGGSSKGLIIGLAVGITLLLIAVLLAVFLWKRAKKAEAEPQPENGGVPPPTAPPAEEDIHEIPKDESMAPDIDLDQLEVLIHKYENAQPHLSSDDDDCVPVPVDASNDESMVPDLDFEELHQIIHQEKEKEKTAPNSDS